MKRSSRLWVSALLCGIFFTAQVYAPGRAAAHPVAQGTLELVIYKDRIKVRARITVEEVTVSTVLRVDDDELYGQAKLTKAFADHVTYFLERFFLRADGRRLQGKLLATTPPLAAAQGISPMDVGTEHVFYDFEFTLPPGETAPITDVDLSHDVLKDKLYTPGVYWQANYVVLYRLYDQEEYASSLLPNDKSLLINAKWAIEPKPEVPEVSPEKTVVDVRQTAKDYCSEGIHHILSGYDHLLFISALVLAAAGFWDLIKVVSVFTLAHSLTLTLSVLNLVTLPTYIVEPMIAGSIVFVGVENIFWPKRSSGWGRLAIAFGFGLFHGLGFAGGLKEAMEGMPNLSLGVAIVAFSIGVEIGHQLIVLPLFGAITALKRTRPDDAGRDRMRELTMRYGSVAISLGGLFYLVGQFIPQ